MELDQRPENTNRKDVCNLQMPAFADVHSLSVSRERITAVTFSPRGDWVALGCASLGAPAPTLPRGSRVLGTY